LSETYSYLIETKRKELFEIGEKLKTCFFGIDKQINSFIKQVEAWYCMPEIFERPHIVCLWGMTGVGKTDLIRKFVEFSGKQDNYAEYSMREPSPGSKFKRFLTEEGIENTGHNIILLDEFQEYRTVDVHGNDIDPNTRGLKDIWEFLSDGKFSIDKKYKYELIRNILQNEIKQSQKNNIKNLLKNDNRFSQINPNIIDKLVDDPTTDQEVLLDRITDFLTIKMLDITDEEQKQMFIDMNELFEKGLKGLSEELDFLEKTDTTEREVEPSNQNTNEKSTPKEESETIKKAKAKASKEVNLIKNTLIKDNKYKMTSFWRIEDVAFNLNIPVTLDNLKEIATWNENLLNEKYLDKLATTSASSVPFSKTLIIICGNLDEAYVIAKNVSDLETDADRFYNETLKIDIHEIKNALSRRFRPEQISRFGNNHIIYQSLNKEAYKKIIINKLNEENRKIKEKLEIELHYNQSIIDYIYNNGVIPVQGTRPLFSSINNYYRNSLPLILLEMIKKNIKSGNLFMETGERLGKDFIILEEDKNIKTEVVSMKTIHEIDFINVKATILHEIGHIIGSLYFRKIIPDEAYIMPTGRASGITTKGYKYDMFFNYLENEIKIGLSGSIFEKILLKNEASTGSWSDAENIINCIKLLIVNRNLKVSITEGCGHPDFRNISISNSITNQDEEINKILEDFKLEVRKELINLLKESNWRDFIYDLKELFYKNFKLSHSDIKKLCELHDIKFINPEVGKMDESGLLLNKFFGSKEEFIKLIN
jgi:hypothetical protein